MRTNLLALAATVSLLASPVRAEVPMSDPITALTDIITLLDASNTIDASSKATHARRIRVTTEQCTDIAQKNKQGVPVTISEQYLNAVSANALIYGENLANNKKDASAQYYAQCAKEVATALKKIHRPSIPVRITTEPEPGHHPE